MNEHHMELGTYLELHGQEDRERFLHRARTPFLVVEISGPEGQGKDFVTYAASGAQEKSTDLGAETSGWGKTILVAELKKSDRNSFANMITIGRASNNDVVIPHNSVSKLHAFLRKESSGTGFILFDAGSTFGTTVKGTVIPQGEGRPLQSGATFVLAKTVKATFFTPADFFDYLQLMSRVRKPQA